MSADDEMGSEIRAAHVEGSRTVQRVSMQGAPTRVLIWGIVIAVAAIALTLFVPNPADWVWLGRTGSGETARIALELVMRIARDIAAPLGAALIAAAIVLGYIKGTRPDL
jgi:hypothetical protein